MSIASCFVKALFVRGDSHSYHLVMRTADVMLKERRKLNLLVREALFMKGIWS